jgi:N6-L-threonylcarbamoyladenine synthase
MRILAIESSCDETSVAVVQNGTAVLSNVIATSQAAFKASGGVIPEEAARKQVESILPTLDQAMTQASLSWNDIDAVAVTKGPGLLGSLLVGTVTARALASVHKKPLIGVHHTLGHLSSTWLETTTDDMPVFPILTLSASGGHTELWLRTSHTHGTLLGRTRDDAAGEAFDKGATLLGLPYPGGPSISKAAANGDANAYDFTMPLLKEDTLDFSFSGMKTALRYIIRDLKPETDIDEEKGEVQNATRSPLTAHRLFNLAASFQGAICLHLLDRVKKAMKEHPNVKELHIVGGVSANTELRRLAAEICTGMRVRFPVKLSYCTDNAAMIASAAEFLSEEDPDAKSAVFPTEASLPLSSAVRSAVR